MRSEKGFTYLWVMFTVALTGVGLAGAGQIWQTELRREKEKELLFVGEQFRRAIESYYESSPGAKRYPESLEKLLSDDRFPTVKRHLRKVFIDPMTGAAEWALIRRPGIGIVGVHSLSAQRPFKRANFPERHASFAEAESYRDWKFIYLPGDTGSTNLPPQSQSQPQSGLGQNPQAEPQPRSEAQPDLQPQPERWQLPPAEPESSPTPSSPSPSTQTDSFSQPLDY
ncbi:MAG: type II secretion system protein [Nitrosospira sp.]|nr:type II secretion system protein [Nitrosospira sp.]